MSPEIIYKRKHDEKVDIWCLGILLFELLHGDPPFTASSMQEISEEMVKRKIVIKKSLTNGTRYLLEDLLKSDTSKRLSIDGVLNHVVFRKNRDIILKEVSDSERKLLVTNY